MDEEEDTTVYSPPIGNILLQMNAISSKIKLDHKLSELLDKFTQELNEADKDMKNGLYFKSFPESALLVQCAANIYAKKVDILWDCLIDYQKRNLEYEKEEDLKRGADKLEEIEQKFKRKRRKKETDDIKEKEVTKETEGNAPRNEKNPFDFWCEETSTEKVALTNRPVLFKQNMLEDFLKPSPKPINPPKYDAELDEALKSLHPRFTFFLRKPRNIVIQHENSEDPLDYSNIFATNIFFHLIEYNNNNLIPDPDNSIMMYRMELEVAYAYAAEKQIPGSTPRSQFAAELPKFAEEYLKREENLTKQYNLGDISEKLQFCQNIAVKINSDKLRRISASDSLRSCDGSRKELNMSSAEDGNCSNAMNKSSANDSGFFENLKCSGTEKYIDDNSNVTIKVEKPNETVVSPQAVLSHKERRCEILIDFSQWKKELKRKLKPKEEKPAKKRKLSVKKILRLCTGVQTTTVFEWERFCYNNYNPEEGEGTLLELPLSLADTEEFENVIDDDQIVGSPTINIPLEDNNIRLLEELSRKRLASNSQMTENLRMLEELPINVLKWKNKIVPILNNLTGIELDIHGYGTDIMDRMKIGEEKCFRDIVNGKPSSEVARYFISSLQLANTENIELSGCQTGKLSNDTLTFKLLSKDRYHEYLSDFTAPSKKLCRKVR